MSDRPRVAFLTMEPPDRRSGGGRLRQSHLLEALAQEADVDLYVADSAPDDVVTAAVRSTVQLAPSRTPAAGAVGRRLQTLGIAVRGGPPEVWSAADALRQVLPLLGEQGPYDVVHVEHPALAGLVRGREAGRRWTLMMQNVGSERARQQQAITVGRRQRWICEREALQYTRLEAKILADFDAVMAVSDLDAELLGGAPVVIANGVDLEQYAPTPLPGAPRVVLTGTLNYLPNVDGALWFLDSVWPLVRRRRPDATLALVGRAPFPSVLARSGQDGVEVHADVASTVPFLAAARVAVVPLRIGSGTRIKALEAMAAGRPVVGTSIGLEGLAVRDGEHVLVRDDPAAFAEAVVSLCDDDAQAHALAVSGRALVVARHSWSELGRAFTAAVLGSASG